eukprot:TRINITY_DN52687_c0_g1_i1.p1 TRINITY_DN52687_c0_g1~~TRINITY_DN52687_c0_g1_i1.p1  ORF type:complete len:125 (-),score=37.12 TRINITY_DN52687_c0_g1_i1:30-404(-)
MCIRDSNKKVLVGEVHGFVNMDITQLAFYPNDSGASTVEEIASLLHQEQRVVVWGHEDNRDIHAKATFLKTNAYQLLTAVSVRIPRKYLSLIHISEPTRLLSISYAVFCLKKKNKQNLRPRSTK